MTKGIYILAIKNGSYANWATVLAASIKYHSPSLHISLVHDDTASRVLPHERSVFDAFIPIDRNDYMDGDIFAPGKAKLNLFKYFQHDQNIYLDADSIAIDDISSLFEKVTAPVHSQVLGYYNQNDESWPCIWMKFDQVKQSFELPETFYMPEINSSFIYSNRSEKAKEFWAKSVQNYIADYRSGWGGAFPDELAFNVAFAQTGIDARISHDSRYPISFDSKDGDKRLGIEKLKEIAPLIGMYGARSGSLTHHYQNYDLKAQQVYRKTFSQHNPYKSHLLFKSKFLLDQKKMGRAVMKAPSKQDIIKELPRELDINKSVLINSHGLISEYDLNEGKRLQVSNWLNGSIINYKNRILFCYRMEMKPYFHYQKLGICELDGKFQPKKETNVLLEVYSEVPDRKFQPPNFAKGFHVEDPRLFERDGKLMLSYTDGYRMAEAEIGTDLQAVESYYLNNPVGIRPNGSDGREKNWIPFPQGNGYIYNVQGRFIVMEGNKDKPAHKIVTNEIKWDWGHIRGGTPVYEWNGNYIMFFHSARQYPAQNMRVYFCGALTFDKNCNILGVSKKPLFLGEYFDERISRPANNVFVVFPAGAVRGDKGWHVSFGYQDYENRVMFVGDELLSNNLI